MCSKHFSRVARTFSWTWKRILARKLGSFSKDLEDLETFLDGNVSYNEMPEMDISESAKAYCPLIERNCVTVDCGNCPTLNREFPDKIWLCSECIELDGFSLKPFWHDGNCDCCDEYSVVLCMAILQPDGQG